MDNLAKAFTMAGSVLIAVLLLGIFLYTRAKLSHPIRQLDVQKLGEEKLKYNAQYEAYNKQLIQGTELYTILNKAIDHAKALGYLTNGQLDKRYDLKRNENKLVNIVIEFKNDPKSPDKVIFSNILEIKALNSFGHAGSFNTGVIRFNNKRIGDYFGLNSPDFMNKMEVNDNILTQNSEILGATNNQISIFKKLSNGEVQEDPNMKKLLERGFENPILRVKNTETLSSNNNWISMEYKTDGYDFMRRRYKCVEIGYDSSGYINLLKFKEITK